MRSGQVTVITADTSYSKFGAKSEWGVDNRGDEAQMLKSSSQVSLR